MTMKQAQELAQDLMRRHKLSPEWSFQFDRSKVRFGKCNFSKQQISLSTYLVEANGEVEIRDTILHEIAHALAPRGAGHGPVWQALALSIGCTGRRCYGQEVARPVPKFKGTCPSCQRAIHRHRRAVMACGNCTAVFDPRYVFIWS
jgi:predicted SprT family Zn-dependent metalloprotease